MLNFSDAPLSDKKYFYFIFCGKYGSNSELLCLDTNNLLPIDSHWQDEFANSTPTYLTTDLSYAASD
jgi:hypothetical protein